MRFFCQSFVQKQFWMNSWVGMSVLCLSCESFLSVPCIKGLHRSEVSLMLGSTPKHTYSYHSLITEWQMWVFHCFLSSFLNTLERLKRWTVKIKKSHSWCQDEMEISHAYQWNLCCLPLEQIQQRKACSLDKEELDSLHTCSCVIMRV